MKFGTAAWRAAYPRIQVVGEMLVRHLLSKTLLQNVLVFASREEAFIRRLKISALPSNKN